MNEVIISQHSSEEYNKIPRFYSISSSVKNYCHGKKLKNGSHSQENNKSIETDLEMVQIFDLGDSDIKADIICPRI